MLEKTVLDNGVVVISEHIKGVPSFAMSFTVRNGSGIETEKNNGVHHLLEHMLFKGNKDITQKDIAKMTDMLGGHLNAFTSREITQFYLKAVDEKFKESFMLLSGMLFGSELLPDEFKKEKKIVEQEIRESEDNPDSYVFDLFYNKTFKGNGIGLPITGTINSLKKITRDRLFKYYKSRYIPENIIISIAGNIQHSDTISIAKDFLPAKKNELHLPENISFPEQVNKGFFIETKSDIQQCYSIIGMDGVSIKSSDRYKFLLFNDIFGAGMNSRLFQKIREEKALAYTISSFPDTYSDFAVLLIFAILDSKKLKDYVEILKNELINIKNAGLSDEEIKVSKDHLKASLILNLESNVSKMRFNLNNELYFGREREYSDIISGIESIDRDGMNNFLNDYINTDKLSCLFYGNPEIRKKLR